MPNMIPQLRAFHFPILALILVCIASCSKHVANNNSEQKPNIVLILADDLGYGDIGCYGGDIETPHIDALARKGVRFSHFHTAPMCAPTRAMLLTGNDNHIAGMGAQSLVTNDFGYEGQLSNRVVTIPTLLKEAGYHSYMTGKWHLGKTPEANPHQRGFDHSYVLLEGAGNHYNNRSALNDGFASFTEDGDSVSWQEGAYSTDFYTDKMIEYIDKNKDDGKPFFAYVAYTSPHWPLQVDEKYWKKYEGRYNDGYGQLRKNRFKSLKKEGIIPHDAILPKIHESVLPWDSLSSEQKRKEARKMELYAGMVDNMDANIGRLITYLKSINEYKNTLFVFMSDNGAAYRDFINSRQEALSKYYNDDYNNMGNADSYISYGPQWAEAGSSPFRYFKDYATQGGMNTTMIISGPQVSRKNEIHHGFTSLLDVAPTFYEIANVSYPKHYKENLIYPLKGTSLIPFMSGKSNQIHDSTYVFAIEHYGHAMLRKGKWKITNYKKPFSTNNFALYDLSQDLAEQNNLRAREPEKFNELIEEWRKYTEEVKVQFPAPSKQ